jgi:hypothetical protein
LLEGIRRTPAWGRTIVRHEICHFRLQVATGRRATTPMSWEALIRTLGVSLIAIAAVVASLTVARQRQDEARPPEEGKRPHLSPLHGSLDLDQLRAAGM